MPLHILTEITGDQVIKGGKRALARIVKQSLRETSEYWHKRLFPRHFEYGNNSRYNLAPRTEFYAKIIKRIKGQGQGRFIDLILSGKSARAMKHLATITSTAKHSTVTMRPPNYFTNPTGNNQPDKVAEILRFSQTDRNDLQRFFTGRAADLRKEFSK